jgi:hypothetical protein
MIDLSALDTNEAWEFVTLASEPEPSDPDRFWFLMGELERRSEAARNATLRVEGIIAGFAIGQQGRV